MATCGEVAHKFGVHIIPQEQPNANANSTKLFVRGSISFEDANALILALSKVAKRETLDFSELQFQTNSTEKTTLNVDKFRQTFSPQSVARAPVVRAPPEMSSGALAEVFDSEASLKAKCCYLAECIRDSSHLVVYTGAGISTSCDIPDFRGPNGVWTRRDRGLAPPTSVRLARAKPSFAHMTLAALQDAGKLKYLVSQNIDGLHRRSGINSELLSEVHGNAFLERCSECNKEYLRSFDVTESVVKGSKDPLSRSGVSHVTGRRCTVCGGTLRDSIVHFSESLPQHDLELALAHGREADVALCLGTSLRVRPACEIPGMASGPMFIVNLQRTPKDAEALRSSGLLIRGRIDDVMRLVMAELDLADHVKEPPEPEPLDDIEEAKVASDLFSSSDLDVGGVTEPTTSCAHVETAVSSIGSFDSSAFSAECSVEECGISQENWICLGCRKVFCGRYGNNHCAKHREQSQQPECHTLALGTSDLGFWCYECDAYIDHQRASLKIFNVYQQAHMAKFGKLSEGFYLEPPSGSPSALSPALDVAPRLQTVDLESKEEKDTISEAVEKYVEAIPHFTDSAARRAQAARHLPWTCDECTFVNEQFPSICESCDANNPSYKGASMLPSELVDHIETLLHVETPSDASEVRKQS